MKSTLMTINGILLLLALSSCAANQAVQNTSTPVNTPKPAIVHDTNYISGPITNGNYSSALTDATSAVTLFMTYKAAEGVPVIEDGVIFEVTKDGSVYYFRYVGGELENVESPTHGQEVTPDEDDWYSNVRVYLP